MGDFSAADVLAMARNNGNGDFLEGNGIIILMLFLLFLGGGGGFNGGWGANAAMQNSFTRAEMQDGFNNQNTVNTLNNLAIGMTNGFNGVNQNLNSLGFQMQQCCCDLKTTMGIQGDLTRSLINQNTMQDLRDKLEEKDRQLNAAIFTNSQQIQTRTLEDFIRANTPAAPAA